MINMMVEPVVVMVKLRMVKLLLLRNVQYFHD